MYDFFEQGDDALIAFGDVSGKGAAAALYGAVISGLLRTMAPRRRQPGALLQALNEALLERKVEAQYATLLVGLWQPKERKFRFANAGSGPPLICRKGEVSKLKVEGVPIGLLEDREYDEAEVLLHPGDTVLLYSDGFEDQMNPADEEYTRGRISRLLKQHHQESPKEIIAAIFADLDAFREGGPITDDQTLVAIRVTE